MRVSKAQAQENRTRVVESASKLFRERGFDGVSVADLMGAAGLTHGGFYKQFASKAELMAESSAWGLAHTSAAARGMQASEFVQRYVSREHRDAVRDGCTLAALCGDAARQSSALKAEFAAGIEALLEGLQLGGEEHEKATLRQRRAKLLDLLAHAVGAVMLSRACPDDSALADEILKRCRRQILEALGKADGSGHAAKTPRSPR